MIEQDGQPAVPPMTGDAEGDVAGFAGSAAPSPTAAAASVLPPASAAEIENLPPEMKTVVSIMAGMVRSPSGPDPETARAIAQSEMHAESCRLQGYKESLRTKDRQNERDHEYRKKRLNHETIKNVIVLFVCVIGILVGLYLLVAKGRDTLGTGLLVASFMALLQGGRALFPKDE
jgi:hypothetical protein